MAYSNFIAAIDLGTSHIAGMIGTKNAAGAITILAYETVSSANCIRRGCIYNMDDAAYLIKGLIQKLNNKIPGEIIEKVYVGIGGQSIRSLNHVVTKSLGNDSPVTTDIIKAMDDECRSYRPEMLDVLDIVSPTYYLNDKKENNPVGVSCSRIEAHYKLIVGRPSLRRDIYGSIKEKAKIDIAGIFVSPLALADAVLSQGEKDLGCALVSFGAGVTSVSIYKNGDLANLWVIPLGGHLITKDIMTLNIVEREAERIKTTYGNMIIDKDDDSTITVNAAEGVGLRDLKLKELYNVVEARMKEIVENVYARIEESDMLNSLGAGIIITGGAASLKNLDIIIKDKFKKDVRKAVLKKGLIEKSILSALETEYTVISLLLKGNMNCAYVPPTPPPPPPPRPPVNPVPEVEINETEEDDTGHVQIEEPVGGGTNSNGNNFISRIKKGMLDLFSDDEVGTKRQENKEKDKD